MRVYGWQGGLHIKPENEEAGELLKQMLIPSRKGRILHGPSSDSFVSNYPPENMEDTEILVSSKETSETGL